MTGGLPMIKKFIPGWKFTVPGCTADKRISHCLWFSRYSDRLFSTFGFLSFGFRNTFSLSFGVTAQFRSLCDPVFLETIFQFFGTVFMQVGILPVNLYSFSSSIFIEIIITVLCWLQFLFLLFFRKPSFWRLLHFFLGIGIQAVFTSLRF